MSAESTTSISSSDTVIPTSWSPSSPWLERGVRAVVRHNLALYSLALVGALALLCKRKEWQASSVPALTLPTLIGLSILNDNFSKKRLETELKTLRDHLDQTLEHIEELEELEDQQLYDLVDLSLDLLNPKQRRKLNRIAESARLQAPLPRAAEIAMAGSGSAVYSSLKQLKDSIRSKGDADDLRQALRLFVNGLTEELEQLRNDADKTTCSPDKGRRSTRRRGFVLVTLLAMGIGIAILKFQGRLAGIGSGLTRARFPRGGAPGA